VDLPTYTNIWRIEKRLYKLYDFRLPMPLPISWIAVFCGITIPYVGVLAAIGLPFNHNLVALYVLPPGVLTWLATRPVLENKRLHELLGSQFRYIGEPRTWCRLVPLSEKNEIRVYARVWHQAPAYAEDAGVLTAPAAGAARETGAAVAPALRGVSLPAGGAGPEPRPGTSRGSGPSRKTWPRVTGRPGRPDQALPAAAAEAPAWPRAGMAPTRASGGRASGGRASGGASGRPVQVRAGSERVAPAPRPGTGRTAPGWTGPSPASTAGSARPARPLAARTGPGAMMPDRRAPIPGQVLRNPAPGGPAPAGPAPARPAGAGPAPAGPRPVTPPPIEVAHETQAPQGPAGVPLWGHPSARRPVPGAPRTPDASAAPGTPGPPHAPATPGAPASRAVTGAPPPRARPEAGAAQPAAGAVEPGTSAGQPGSGTGQPGSVDTAPPVPAAPPEVDRPAPSIERALSGPDRIDSWQRRVRVVPGGQGPGQRDQETLDRNRARLPLTGSRRIVFLGCTSGAGQTVTALMTGQLLAVLRGDPVAAIDLNPGHGSLARQAQAAPALTVAALLEGSAPHAPARATAGGRFDVISADADPVSSPLPGPPVPGDRDYARLAEQAGRHYTLTMLDPGASEVTRILAIADQLVLVAPASADAPRSLAMTQEWLNSNGHAELAARAVTVVNGVSQASMSDVEQAEAVARGRCRAIVRIPWDDVLAAAGAGPGEPNAPAGPTAPAVSSLRPQVRHAYTALAGVLVAGLAAAPVPRKVLH